MLLGFGYLSFWLFGYFKFVMFYFLFFFQKAENNRLKTSQLTKILLFVFA